MPLVVTIISSFGDDRHSPTVAAMRARPNTTVIDYRSGNSPLALHIDRRGWSPERFLVVQHAPEVRTRFKIDRSAIERSDVVVLLVTPERCGRASHTEFGYGACLNKPVIVYVAPGTQPETAYLWARAIVFNIPGLLAALDKISADTHVTRLAGRA